MNITSQTGRWRGTWKNRRVSTDVPLKRVQHRLLTANFKGPIMNMAGSQCTSLWIQCTFLSRMYGLFRSDFLQHRGFDFTVHLIADTVTLAGLFSSLIYMGLAFLWVPDVIPHGSRWYQCLWFLRSSKEMLYRKPPKAQVVYLPIYILIQSICLPSHLVGNCNGPDGCRVIPEKSNALKQNPGKFYVPT